MTKDNNLVGKSMYHTFRDDIIFGRLAAGEKLRLDALHKRYDVSVTTLREILNRLTSDGFVIARDQKGFQVAPVSDADLAEVADLRILLEGHALKRAFQSGDLDWEVSVVAAHHRLHVLEKRMLEGDKSVWDDWKRADCDFHNALILGCASEQLIGLHREVFDKYLRYQLLTLTFRGNEAVQEHKDLLDAALARDYKAATKVLKQHVKLGVAKSDLNSST